MVADCNYSCQYFKNFIFMGFISGYSSDWGCKFLAFHVLYIQLLLWHTNASTGCCFFYIRYFILTASSLVSLLHKYFKLIAKAKFGHWKFWDSQTPHIWFQIVNLALKIEPYKIHTHTFEYPLWICISNKNLKKWTFTIRDRQTPNVQFQISKINSLNISQMKKVEFPISKFKNLIPLIHHSI